MARHCRLALTITLFAIVTVARATPELLPARPFAVGEQLNYRIRLGPVTVGTATLELVGLQTCGQRTAYIMRYTARSNRLISSVYPVRDRITSWADTLDFRSHRYTQRIREGQDRFNRDVLLDHTAGLAISSEGDSLAIPPGCHDVFSALLRIRASRLDPGATVSVQVIMAAQTAVLDVSVGPLGRVKVPAGEFPCIQVIPLLGNEGPIRHEGPMTIDLSRDGRGLPVRIRMRVPVVGYLSVELTDIADIRGP